MPLEPASKSPELQLFAWLCGLPRVEFNLYDLYNAFRTCLSLGERGYGIALALLNIVLGGLNPAPDLVSAIPPGYLAFIKRMSLVDWVVLQDHMPDIVFPTTEMRTTSMEDKEGANVEVVVEKYPRAFGVYIEYEHPVHGLSKILYVLFEARTGDYLYKAFIAPQSVTEKISEIIAVKGFAEAPEVYDEIYSEVEGLLRQFSIRELQEKIMKGEIKLPRGVKVYRREEERERRRW